MEVDLNHVFKTLDGEDIIEKKKTAETNQGPVFESVKITARKIFVNALLNSQDPKLNGEEKAKRYELAMRIHNGRDKVDLSLDECKLLKDLIGQFGSPLIVGQAWQILDPKH